MKQYILCNVLTKLFGIVIWDGNLKLTPTGNWITNKFIISKKQHENKSI